MTIKEAIKEVMRRKGKPMTIHEAYDAIIADNLYKFNAANPFAVVRSEIRRHCLGIDFPSASRIKHFELKRSNRYYFLDAPVKMGGYRSSKEQKLPKEFDHGISQVRIAQAKHRDDFSKAMIKKIKKIPPEKFEHFTKNLLEAYGFEDVEVTSYSRDGGIDGYGKLKIGLGLIGVAFQCKRYTTKSVSTNEVQQFRGAIQGKYELGLLFTTSGFTRDCERLNSQRGAVPIIMIDGKGIVDIMIDKEFGAGTESVSVFTDNLDSVLADS